MCACSSINMMIFAQGINVFFDCVGGEIRDAVLENMAVRGRVVQCGAISQYNVGDKVCECFGERVGDGDTVYNAERVCVWR